MPIVHPSCSCWSQRGEVPRAGVLEVRGRREQVLPARHRPDLRRLQGPRRLHLRQPVSFFFFLSSEGNLSDTLMMFASAIDYFQADPAQVRERGRLRGRVADRAGGGARRRPEHVLRHATRSVRRATNISISLRAYELV